MYLLEINYIISTPTYFKDVNQWFQVLRSLIQIGILQL